MKKKKSGLFLTVLPLYLFTLCFVVGPLLYMVALSFTTNGSGSSTIWNFTLENYKKIAEPVYLKSFVQSFQLAITSTLLIVLMGYPFGYFMAKLSAKWKKTDDAFDYGAFLDQFFNPYVWLDFNFAGKRCFKWFSHETGTH